MARIKTFRCTGKKCRYVVRLADGFPVWHAHTPTHLRKMPVAAEAISYVARFRSELLCRYCKKTVDASADLVCPQCRRGGIYADEEGRLCPQCIAGTLVLEHYSIL